MVNVHFTDEETTLRPATRFVNKKPSLTQWLIRRGVVKNQAQANILFIVIIAAGCIYIFTNLPLRSDKDIDSPQPDYVAPSEQ